MKTPLTFLLSLTFLFLFGCQTVGGDTYQRTLSYAERGNVTAQSDLGTLYAQGQGVPQDFKEAVKWYRLSAEQGEAKAQYNLGNMYAKGTGVLQDYALAHMWLNISGSNGHKNAVYNRGIIEKRMSPSQIEKAQEMARN
jgi:uncharacterized protein